MHPLNVNQTAVHSHHLENYISASCFLMYFIGTITDI